MMKYHELERLKIFNNWKYFLKTGVSFEMFSPSVLENKNDWKIYNEWKTAKKCCSALPYEKLYDLAKIFKTLEKRICF